MESNATEGFCLTVGTAFLALVAAANPNPWVRLVASIGAAITAKKSIDCFQASARRAYQELASSSQHPQLPQGQCVVRLSPRSQQ